MTLRKLSKKEAAVQDNSSSQDPNPGAQGGEEQQPVIGPQLSPPVEAEGVKQASTDQTRQELDEAVKGSEEVILEITTPFPLFPITITLDRAKIAVSKRHLFSTTALASLPVIDVLNVTSESNLFFGFVKIDKRILSAESPFRYGPFLRQDAIRMAAIAQGYVVALQRQIDLSPLPLPELREKLTRLGEDRNVKPDQPLP